MISDIISPIISDIITKSISGDSDISALLKTSKLWLNSTDAASLGGPANDDLISLQNDLSDSGNNAIQTIPSLQPKYKINGINGLPALYYDLNALELLTPINTTTSEIFIIAVGDVDDDIGVVLGSVDSNVQYRFQASSNRFQIVGAPRIWNNTTGSIFYDSTIPHVLNIRTTPTSAVIAVDGVDGATNNSVVGTEPLVSQIGSFFNFDGASPFKGHIGEIIIFDKILTTSERQAISAYLTNKWIP